MEHSGIAWGTVAHFYAFMWLCFYVFMLCFHPYTVMLLCSVFHHYIVMLLYHYTVMLLCPVFHPYKVMPLYHIPLHLYITPHTHTHYPTQSHKHMYKHIDTFT